MKKWKMRHCTDFFSCLLLFFVFNLFPLLLKSLSLHYTFVLAWQWFHFSFFPLLLLINFFFCVAKFYCEWTFGFVEGFMLYLFRRLKRKRTKFEIIFCLTCAIIMDEFIWRGKKYTKINKTEKIDGNFFKKGENCLFLHITSSQKIVKFKIYFNNLFNNSFRLAKKEARRMQRAKK